MPDTDKLHAAVLDYFDPATNEWVLFNSWGNYAEYLRMAEDSEEIIYVHRVNVRKVEHTTPLGEDYREFYLRKGERMEISDPNAAKVKALDDGATTANINLGTVLGGINATVGSLHDLGVTDGRPFSDFYDLDKNKESELEARLHIVSQKAKAIFAMKESTEQEARALVLLRDCQYTLDV